MFIRFKKKTALPVCAYDDAHRRWGAGVDEEFEAGDETEVSLLRENEDTLDIEIPGSGIVFDLPKADVDVLPLDAVEGSHILQGILPWPWEAEPTTEVKTGEVRWEVLQSQNLHNGTHLGPGPGERAAVREQRRGGANQDTAAKSRPSRHPPTPRLRRGRLASRSTLDARSPGEGGWDILLCSDARLTEAEARLIVKAPEMYVLLRQLLAGQPVMTQVGHLINGLELSMEKGKP